MQQNISRILLTEEQIQTRVKELSAQLSVEYAGKDPIFVGVLKGVVMFYADFLKYFQEPCQMDFMWVSSYSGTTSTGKMDVKQDLSQDIKGRHVVILEDIFDTGNSLQFTYEHLLAKEPASLKICTLLDKPERHYCYLRLYRLCDSQRVRCGLRPGLQRAFPEPALRGRSEARSIRKIRSNHH